MSFEGVGRQNGFAVFCGCSENFRPPCSLFLSDWIMDVFRLLEVKSSSVVRIRLQLGFFCGWAEIFFNEML